MLITWAHGGGETMALISPRYNELNTVYMVQFYLVRYET